MNRPAPEVFYLQMDGGMENSNKTTLAISALLVVMGVFKTVVVTRIMRGHGHLDPDRKFGIISRASHSKTLYTPQVTSSIIIIQSFYVNSMILRMFTTVSIKSVFCRKFSPRVNLSLKL